MSIAVDVVDDINLMKSNGFAVVQLKPGMETRLLQVLMENGYTNVSFTNAKGESVNLDDEDEDEEIDIELVKENQENETTNDDQNKKIEEKETTSSIFMRKIENQDEDSIELEKLEAQAKDQAQIEPPSPIEFSSLTLPTVLWSEQPKFSFYNPFLPFLSYLPQTAGADPMMMINGMKTGDLPFFPSADMRLPHWAQHPNIGVPTQILDTPPSTPRNSSGSSQHESTCLITGAKLRQRGRQLRRHERDSSAYASCRLCRNRILANRLSNLHNHVRRHAVLKQFHCCYCSYAHTEVAKVRLHMLHNHKDDRSQPLDKRNDDMETAWSMLMRECFPGYA
jgi:hypothetical protein